jgi:hypothetical protein
MQQPSHITAYRVARILKRRKIEDVLGEDQFGFRRGNGNRDAMGMLIIIQKRTFGHKEGIVSVVHRTTEDN